MDRTKIIPRQPADRDHRLNTPTVKVVKLFLLEKLSIAVFTLLFSVMECVHSILVHGMLMLNI